MASVQPHLQVINSVDEFYVALHVNFGGGNIPFLHGKLNISLTSSLFNTAAVLATTKDFTPNGCNYLLKQFQIFLFPLMGSWWVSFLHGRTTGGRERTPAGSIPRCVPTSPIAVPAHIAADGVLIPGLRGNQHPTDPDWLQQDDSLWHLQLWPANHLSSAWGLYYSWCFSRFNPRSIPA